ncbi:MAG TPA: trigger factor [Acidimicrobiales bacterium]|nr:trigger factor [Acidimicrobiales bacterium]
MKATVAPLEGNKVKVSVEVDEAEFDKAVDAAFRKIAQEVRIPGFRPGKAPRKILERRLGANVGREQALHDSLPEFYAQALSEHDVDAIAAPEIDITAGEEGEGPLAFDAVVEVRPEVQVPGYGSLRVEIDRPDVADEDVEAQIDRMRQVQATTAPVDRSSQEGDVVTIDITGTLDGDAQDGLTADDYSYTVGSGMITPEVDENLRGVKPGEILSFPATHPDEEETRELEFRVLVKEVNERVLPEADDEWAEENSQFDTIEALRGNIRENLLARQQLQAQMQVNERTREALAKLVDMEPPATLVDKEVQDRLQEMALRLRAQGLDLDQWLSATGKAPEELLDEMRAPSADGVKIDLALRAVADAEQIVCDDEDVDAEIEGVAQRLGEKPRKVLDRLERGGQLPGLRSDIRKRKALDWLVERVELVDQEGKPVDRADLEVAGDEQEGAPAGQSGQSGSTAANDDDSAANDDTESE